MPNQENIGESMSSGNYKWTPQQGSSPAASLPDHIIHPYHKSSSVPTFISSPLVSFGTTSCEVAAFVVCLQPCLLSSKSRSDQHKTQVKHCVFVGCAIHGSAFSNTCLLYPYCFGDAVCTSEVRPWFRQDADLHTGTPIVPFIICHVCD